jgi:RNA polymerase sigma factor (sigma-70 family)
LASAPLEQADRIDGGGPDPLSALVTGERLARVREAIRRLPPRQRATVILRVYQDLSHEDIARVLGSSVGAAKTNFFHALVNLRRLVGG